MIQKILEGTKRKWKIYRKSNIGLSKKKYLTVNL